MLPQLRDARLWSRAMTMRRTRNAYDIWSSFRDAKRTKVPQIKGMPVSISIEPTTACNLRCPECPSGLRAFTRPTGTSNTGFSESDR